MKPPAPFRLTGALMAMSTWAGVMPAWMLTFCPLIVNVPPFAMAPGRICVPVIWPPRRRTSVAPKPVILAGAGAPAIGLAE